MKFIAWSYEDIKVKDQELNKTLYLFYDYSQIEYDLYTYLDLRLKQKAQFQEEEVWELLHYMLTSFVLSGNETFEYVDVEPFSIYITKSPYVKYITSNLNLRVPTSKWEENQLPVFNTDEFVQGLISQRGVESNFLFKLGMLCLFLLSGLQFSIFNIEMLKDKLENSITKKLEEQQTKVSEQLLSFITKCLQKVEFNRPKSKDLIQEYAQNLYGQGLSLYDGQLKNEKVQFEKYIGLIREDNKIKNPQGLGRSEVLTGNFQDSEMYGIGIHVQNQVITYGEWYQNKIQNGIIHNKQKGYIFFGEFADPQLSKAKGLKLHLNFIVEQMPEENVQLVEEGYFVNDKVQSQAQKQQTTTTQQSQH